MPDQEPTPPGEQAGTRPSRRTPGHPGYSDQDPTEATQRQRSNILRATRVIFVIALLSVALLRLIVVGDSSDSGIQSLSRLWYLTFGLAAALAAFFITIDVLTPTKKIATMVTVAVGLLVGVLATIVFGLVIDLIAQTYTIHPTFVTMFKVLLGICFCYLGVTIVLQTQDDVRLVIPYVEFAKQLRGPRPLILDSSALIDARFPDALLTGFFQAPIVIPRFVLIELQQLADSHDKLKRSKGRRALDIVARLQRNPSLDVSIDPTLAPGVGVDQALVDLAVRTRGKVVTTDSGLARIAIIQGATVLNVNELAAALRPALAAGETLTVKLVKPGEQPGQAVGYLADGTMIVAEDGAPHVGREVSLMVISTLQTSAGRLVFARTTDGESTGRSLGPDPAAAESSGDLTESASEPATDEAGESSAHPDDDDATPGREATPRGPFPPRGVSRPKNRLRNPRR
ncbi:MAG: hypothetical protein L6Q35_11675 [Phycisphaerales bacterium]|nr:hypothetical protein [Phycisphaerales bacterium]